MSKELTSTIEGQIDSKDIKTSFVFEVNSTDFSDYVMNWSISADRNYGSMSATFTLNNDGGIFGNGGANEIKVGDVVELTEKFEGDATEFKKFYGVVNQRGVTKSGSNRLITLTCLDYISLLQQWDLDLEIEGNKILVENTTLTPNFLSPPNDKLAQVFDFPDNSIADNPLPILKITSRPGQGTIDDPQYDGFEIYYDVGQVKLGTPLNTYDLSLNPDGNYDLIAVSYYHYIKGVYAEDVLEEILTQQDGFGGYLFGESSKSDVIDNHLKDTFNNVTGKSEDVMTPNLTSTTITIETTLNGTITPKTPDAVIALIVDSTAGFPSSGSGEINGDAFTWTGKTDTTLTGCTGLYPHKSGSVVEYEASYSAGQVWYLYFSNIVTDMDSGDFSIGGGGTFNCFDKRYGRIILTSAIDTGSTVECTTDYTFKTLQATGIELNKISFRPRELANRYEGINKLRNYLAPNYIIRTIGDDKIWASYLSQKTVEDYELNLAQQLNYLEDEDLYTRVVMYGKNKNPTNILFNEDVEFVTPDNVHYKGFANMVTLSYDREEGNFLVFRSFLGNVGYIDNKDLIPQVFIDSYQIKDSSQLIEYEPVEIEITQRIETTVDNDFTDTDVTTHTYWYYKVKFPRAGIDPRKVIHIYSATRVLLWTIDPFDKNMDYARGIYTIPGSEQNEDAESVSMADYYVYYDDDYLQIEYGSDGKVPEFKISKNIIKFNAKGEATAEEEIENLTNPSEDRETWVSAKSDWSLQRSIDVVYYYEEFEVPDADTSYYISMSGYTQGDHIWVAHEDVLASSEYTLDYDEREVVLDTALEEDFSASQVISTTLTTVFYNYQGTMNVADTSDFPSSGSGLVGEKVFNYTSKDSTHFYGVTMPGVHISTNFAVGTIVKYASWEEPPAGSKRNQGIRLVYRWSTDSGEVLEVLSKVEANFYYWNIMTTIPKNSLGNLLDGRWDTQAEVAFADDPGSGMPLAILDLKQEYDIQAIDIVAGFYLDPIGESEIMRRFDINFAFSIEYSTDGTTYYTISDATHNIKLSGGESISLEEDDLGVGLSARYLKLVLEDVEKLEIGEKGIYPVAFANVSIYNNIIIKSEAKLGVDVADPDGLQSQLGDRLYKDVRISDEYLYTQAQLDDLAVDYLEEFYKNHSKVGVNVMYAPYICVGDTVKVTDTYNDIDDRYFVDSVEDNTGSYTLVLARYP